MTKSTFEEIFDKLENIPLKKKVMAVDKVAGQVNEIVFKLHQLKFRYWMDYQTAIHEGEWWTEKEITKKEAKALFDDFLVVYRFAFGKEFDNYSRMSREQVFENWKAHMKWFYKRNKKFSDKLLSQDKKK